MSLERKELAEAIKDHNSSDAWISLKASSQALMVAMKRQSRFDKGKVFNGFVLEQRSPEDNEFDTFINQLKLNANNIPPGTRIQLAVMTKYVDPVHDKDFYDLGIREQAHWTAIDLLVSENGKIDSFVLDAANAVGYRGMHAKLKEVFPTGEHYVFKDDALDIQGKKKVRKIQYLEIGCQVFVTDHMRQLSQIHSDVLYDNELAKLAVNSGEKTGEIYPGSFVGGEKLIRILRGMQSWAGLNALRKEVLETYITENETLEQSAKKGTEDNKNLTIFKKNQLYKEKKKKYFESMSNDMCLLIMQQRQGYTLIQNPVLFQVNEALAAADVNKLKGFISALCELLTKSNFTGSEKKTVINAVSNLKKFSSKNDILFNLTSLMKYFDDEIRLKSGNSVSANVLALQVFSNELRVLADVFNAYLKGGINLLKQDSFTSRVNNEKILNMVMYVISQEDTVTFANLHADKIESGSGLSNVLEHMPMEKRLDFISQHEDKVRNADDVNDIASVLMKKDRMGFVNKHLDKITNGDGLSCVADVLANEDKFEFITKHVHKINNFGELTGVIEALSDDEEKIKLTFLCENKISNLKEAVLIVNMLGKAGMKLVQVLDGFVSNSDNLIQLLTDVNKGIRFECAKHFLHKIESEAALEKVTNLLGLAKQKSTLKNEWTANMQQHVLHSPTLFHVSLENKSVKIEPTLKSSGKLNESENKPKPDTPTSTSSGK